MKYLDPLTGGTDQDGPPDHDNPGDPPQNDDGTSPGGD